jgi:phytoene synthase
MSVMSAAPGDAIMEKSRSYCEQLTRAQAKNFYYGLKLLPEPKRSAMFALYAYMRRVDDIADEQDGRSVQQRMEDLDLWRMQTRAAVLDHQGETPTDPVWPALAETVRRYRLPGLIFDEVVEGQRQDLDNKPFSDFSQLRMYCYRVAGVVGLASIHVWGFEGGEATQTMAINRGIAFQLTNILRDLREDSDRGRTYLPADELSAMKVSAEDLRRGGSEFLKMMRFQIERAESYYAKSAELEERIERDSRPTLRAMTEIYHGLLEKIAADPQRVLNERVSLSVFSKLRIGWRAMRAG